MQSSRFHAETVIGGKWVLDRPLGRGGMGEVWVAKHASLDEEVALKLLDRRTLPAEILDEARSRFHLEAQIAARLAKKSRHIAGVVDHGHEGDFDYLVLELLRGSPLDGHLEKVKRVPPSETAAIVRQITRALAVAHREGVVHRDLKPGNVFITHDDEGRMLVKLLDFGIAKSAARPPRPVTVGGTALDGDAPRSSHRTRVGIVLGTPEYMSPEQARGTEVDARADVWALACITFEMLTGVVPFSGETETDVMINVCMGRGLRARDVVPELPLAIDDLFTRAFDLELERRFADPASFSAALDHALQERGSIVEISVGGGVPMRGPDSFPLVVPIGGAASGPMSAARPVSVSVPGVVLERADKRAETVVAEARQVEAPSPKRSRAPAFLAAGAVSIALIAAFFVLRGSPPPAPASASEPRSAPSSETPATPPTQSEPHKAPVASAGSSAAPTATPTTGSTPTSTKDGTGSTAKPKAPPTTPTAGKTKPAPPPGTKKVDPSEIL